MDAKAMEAVCEILRSGDEHSRLAATVISQLRTENAGLRQDTIQLLERTQKKLERILSDHHDIVGALSAIRHTLIEAAEAEGGEANALR